MSSISDSEVVPRPADGRPAIARRHLVLLLPVTIFAGVAIMFGILLDRDPSALPSALTGKPVPEFSLPPVQGRALGLSREDLTGDVSRVNVFASCVHGLNYNDQPENAAAWLESLGDPYTRTGADVDLYGVPETFAIGADGTVRYKHIGPITQEVLDKTNLPLVDLLRRQQGGGS